MTIDRSFACQEAMNDRLFALMNEAAEAGWTESEIVDAVHDLTLAWHRWRCEKRATDRQVAATARLHRQ